MTTKHLLVLVIILTASCLVEKDEIDENCTVFCTMIRGNINTGLANKNVENVTVSLKNYDTGIAGGTIITKGETVTDKAGNYEIEFSYIDSLNESHRWKLELEIPDEIYNPSRDDDEIYKVNILPLEPEMDTIINFVLPERCHLKMVPKSDFTAVIDGETIFFYLHAVWGPNPQGKTKMTLDIINANQVLEIFVLEAIANNEIVLEKEIRRIGGEKEHTFDTLFLEEHTVNEIEFEY